MIDCERDDSDDNDVKHDVGNLGRGQRKEVCNKWRGIDNHQTYQQVVVLWLKSQKDCRNQVCPNENGIEQADANAVQIALVEEMDRTHDAQCD